MDERFRMQMVFPVDGDSGIVELIHDGEQWADIRLEDLRLDAVGEDRLRDARAVLVLRPPTEQTAWEFDYAEAVAQLQDAHDNAFHRGLTAPAASASTRCWGNSPITSSATGACDELGWPPDAPHAIG